MPTTGSARRSPSSAAMTRRWPPTRVRWSATPPTGSPSATWRACRSCWVAAIGAGGNGKPEKASAADFIEEMGKTGHARVINVGPARQLAPLSPGDAVELALDGDVAGGARRRGADRPGRAARRRPAGQADEGRQPLRGGHHGGRAATRCGSSSARPSPTPTTSARSRFPGSAAGRPAGVRPDIRGSALRYDDEGEESEELEEEAEEVEELDTSLPEFSAEPELEEELLEEP